MGRRPNPLDPNNPLHAFAIELVELRDLAGAAGQFKSTFEQTGITRTTYYAWLGGKQLPGRDALELVVRAWGGDVKAWMLKRRQVQLQLSKERGYQSDHKVVVEPPTVALLNKAVDRVVGSPGAMSSADLKLHEARELLRAAGLDAERSNDRSAYVLLALLMLGPNTAWRAAGRPILRMVDIMQWLRDVYHKDYKPNTRETIRRGTLKHFIEAGIVVQNPDKPGRPINSPEWSYQVSSAFYRKIRAGEWKNDEF